MVFTRRLIYATAFSIIFSANTKAANDQQDVRQFPNGFLFGAATASYQVEGGWNEDGKSENIWDAFTHLKPSPILDNTTGDMADDSYHQYKRDVEMVRELGLDYYRFSLSWTRILPTSFPDQINEAGVLYYNNLIDELLRYNIKPIVTIYHWDLPKKLQDLGGWTNPEIINWYADYARIAFDLFGDRVRCWITINEPVQICYFGYGLDSLAPAIDIKGVAEYMCAKNVLMAHAKVYHIYDEEFRPKQGGNISISLSVEWFTPESEDHVEATEDYIQFTLGQYANPIFSQSGDFPKIMKQRVADKSKAQGFSRSRLPDFSEEEISFVKGTSDFFGLNHYSTHVVFRNKTVESLYEVPSLADDANISIYQLSEWKIGESDMTKVVPWGFYEMLTRIREEYNNPPIYITENGFSSHGGLTDDDRIYYYRSYLSALLDAIKEGSDIRAYTVWSLMDNFEWKNGYTERLGLYEVNYEDAARMRTPRKSAFVYKEIVRSRALDWSYQPDTDVMTIDDGH